jgi:undecaprenyl-diphosphatase
VLEGETQHFDDVTRNAVHSIASPTLTATMRGISFTGSSFFLTGATIVMFMWLMSRGWQRDAWLLAITMIGASILNTTLKLTFHRPRPVPFFNLLAPESYSFPSGHSLASFCFFGALASILTTRITNPKINLLTWATAGTLVFLIGLSRIYLGVHYTTDVLAGFAGSIHLDCYDSICRNENCEPQKQKAFHRLHRFSMRHWKFYRDDHRTLHSGPVRMNLCNLWINSM